VLKEAAATQGLPILKAHDAAHWGTSKAVVDNGDSFPSQDMQYLDTILSRFLPRNSDKRCQQKAIYCNVGGQSNWQARIKASLNRLVKAGGFKTDPAPSHSRSTTQKSIV